MMKRLIVLMISLTFFVGLKADETNIQDSITIIDEDIDIAQSKPQPFLQRAMGVVSDFFMGCDSDYVTRVPYDFTAEIDLYRWHDFYSMTSSQTGNSMVIKSAPSLVVGGYLFYNILGYGISYNINDIGKPEGEMNGTGIRQSLVAHTAKFYAEFYKFNSGKSAEISHISNMNLRGRDAHFTGLDSRCNGISAFYILNNRRFSWPAAFSGSAVQRRSQGSWSVGFQYNHQRTTFDKDALPNYIKDEIDPTLMFNEVDYDDYSVSCGYSYNWVMRRNCLLGVSFLPNIGYRRSNIIEATNEHNILNNVATDLNMRMSLMWNNTKTYTALMFEQHTYSYRKAHFGLTNTYGTLKLVMGLQFLKKRQ